MDIVQILTKYWGYTKFRPMQEDIIQSVLAGKDTMALLPTGGGKSVCFQVPGLAMDGITLVVSPLIALMKDQVENLQRRGVKAAAIVSGMHRKEIDITLDNCIYGHVKFLYVSPERLTSELFIERFRKMDVNLIAVDEAHCISQWGYDFRPHYLRINEIRELLDKPAPVIALTATATPEVVTDIQEKLEFSEPNVFQLSFLRKNLAYIVVKDENKLGRLRRMLEKVKGSAIVYVRNRRRTKEIAHWLYQQGISADFYHAGLKPEDRSRKQSAWIDNQLRVIVATNAFGMGIDKPNVRLVVHMDLPDSPEAYFQEAGRAGRDEKKAFAVVVWDQEDVEELEQRLEQSYPHKRDIRNVYQALGNHYQLAIGAGMETLYPFHIGEFSEKHKLDLVTTYNALKILELDDYIRLSEILGNVSKVKVEVTADELYKYQIANRKHDGLIQLMLRSYTGIFENLTRISEFDLSKRTRLPEAVVEEQLAQMAQQEVISYLPKSKRPLLSFPYGRIANERLRISKAAYEDRQEAMATRIQAMINYVKASHKCRSQQLLNYFGEEDAARCGVCDVCLERNKLDLSNLEFETVSDQIKELLGDERMTLTTLIKEVDARDDKTIKVIQWLTENGKLMIDPDGLYFWRK